MFRRRRTLDDFSAEIDSHLDQDIARLREQGLDDDAARAAAHRNFGNVTLARERFYEARRWLWLDHAVQDVRYAVRMLRKAPGFTSIAVLTLALGIGATTAIFSVVDATLLRPLPYPHPEQLVSVQDDLEGIGSYDVGMSQPEWLDLEGSGIFEHVSPAWFDENNLTGASTPTRVRLISVAPNYFALLGITPELGRQFPPDDRSPSFTGEVIISDAMWRRELGADPGVLNRSIRLDTDLYHIVGVLPPEFRGLGRSVEERNNDVWAATSFYGPPMFDHPPRNSRNLPGAVARIKSGLTVADAQRRVDALVASLRATYPADYPVASGWSIRLVPLQNTLVGPVRRALLLLFGAVGVVLTIGCANIAGLLLARAGARARELAVRQSLGAGRRRLVRQLLTENVVLSILGGVAGLIVLVATRRLLLELIPETLPRLNDIGVNWRVLVFALVSTFVCGVAFGLAPILDARRLNVLSALKSETRGVTGSRERGRARQLLVVTEFALSLVLLVAAGLLVRSLYGLLNAPLGFNPRGVLTVRTRLPYPNDVSIDKYGTVEHEAAFLREVLRRLQAVPGVEQAALGSSSAIPLDHAHRDVNVYPLLIEGRGTDPTQVPLVNSAVVTPEYFSLLGIPLSRGRLITDLDRESTPAVAVINEAMARTFWPDTNPIGQRVKLSRSPTTAWTTIVGVIANARTESVDDGGTPQIYASAYQKQSKHLAIFLSGQLDAAKTPETVREQVQSVDDSLPVFGAEFLADAVSASLATRRFAMEVVGLFAGIALLLAALGIYGVISYTVSERTREIGIRLALGAERWSIFSLVLSQGWRVILVGVAVGLVGSVAVSRLMAGVLFGIGAFDWVTIITVTFVLVAVAFAACYLPARRALRIEPMIALKYE
jgi:putative ABC transport system permease protein